MASAGLVNSAGADAAEFAAPLPTIAISPNALVAGTNKSLVGVTSIYLTGIDYVLLP
jgi:hypothetical protein